MTGTQTLLWWIQLGLEVGLVTCLPYLAAYFYGYARGVKSPPTGGA